MITDHGQRTHHSGDVAVIIAPVADGALDHYLHDYLAGPVGTCTFPVFQLGLRTGSASFDRAVTEFTYRATRLVEPIPGVVLAESSTSAGDRCFTVAQDALENIPDAWAVSVHGQKINLYVRAPSMSPRYVLRIIREVMIRSYENAGAIIFHAAGLDLGGNAVMICGGGTTGKTTTLATLLRHFEDRAALLSNDRLLVLDHNEVVAVPLPVPLARGTIEAFGELRAALPGVARARPGEMAFDTLPRVFGTTRKIAFPARVFAEAFGAGMIPGSRLAAIIIPSITDTKDHVTVRLLDSVQATEALTGSCFTPVDEFWHPWLIKRTHPDKQLSDVAAACCRRLGETIPCFAVGVGIRGRYQPFEQALTDVIGDFT
jgi:hypothetical protein